MKEILSKLPIYTDRLEIDILDEKSVNWYAKESKKPRYYRYLNNKATHEATLKQIKDRLLYLISRQKLSDCEQLRFIIYDKTSRNTRLGSIVLFDNSSYIEIAYWLSASAEGKGIAHEALNIIINNIYDTIGDIELRLFIHKDNIRSIRLAQRCGFKNKEKIENALVFIREAR